MTNSERIQANNEELQVCIDKANSLPDSDGGYEQGYADGYEDGNTEGYTKGHTEGVEEGYVSGRESMMPLIGGFISGGIEGEISNNETESIKPYAFYQQNKIEAVNFPNAIQCRTYSFANCSALKEISMPNLQACGDYSFYGSGIENIDFPNLTTGAANAFNSCVKAQIATLPKLTSVDNGFLRGCSILQKADIGNAQSIGNMAFYFARELKTLIIRSEVVCSLSASSVFSGTFIESGTGTIYVADELVEEYKDATNWANYASQIKPISELEETA